MFSNTHNLGLEVLTAMCVHIAVFVLLHRVVSIFRVEVKMRVVCSSEILITTLMMEAASTSEMSVNFCQTTRRNITEDSHLHTQYCGDRPFFTTL
jgi:hypothetical protein